MDVECMWSGSMYHMKVFTDSSVNANLRENKLATTFQTPVHGEATIWAYLLLPFCMKEYKTRVSNEEVIFNNMLQSPMNPVECTFGHLKARWAILTRWN